MTTYFNPILLTASAILKGSSLSNDLGFPVVTLQNLQFLVHISPIIMKKHAHIENTILYWGTWPLHTLCRQEERRSFLTSCNPDSLIFFLRSGLCIFSKGYITTHTRTQREIKPVTVLAVNMFEQGAPFIALYYLAGHKKSEAPKACTSCVYRDTIIRNVQKQQLRRPFLRTLL